MGWKTIPGTDGWEVNEELSLEGRLLLRKVNGAGSLFDPLHRLGVLLDDKFDQLNDPRVHEKTDGTVEVSVNGRVDIELYCTPVDYSFFIVIRTLWPRNRWNGAEEQVLIEKCLDELYENGSLSEDTSAALKEYQRIVSLTSLYIRTPDGKLDYWTFHAHPLFMSRGLNWALNLDRADVRRIQKFAGARITERYDLQTARAVKRKQKELTDDEKYDGPIDGIWNEKMQPFLERFTREQELLREGRGIISSFGEIPQEGALSDPEKWAAYANSIIESHLKKLHQCFREKYGRDPVQGDQDELAQQIRGLNAIQTMIEIGLHNIEWAEQQLRRREEEEWEEFWEEFFSKGGTWSRMRNQFQLECIELWVSAACFAYDAAAVGSWVTRRFFGTQATRAVQQSLARLARKEVAEEVLKRGLKKSSLRRIFGKGFGKPKQYILREGTDLFRLPKEAFKSYPKGVKRPKGLFRLVSKGRVDALRSQCTKNFRERFKLYWKKQNPGKIWDNAWDIHHVKPLKFGGNNKFDNLVPVTKSQHRALNSFWEKLKHTIGRIGAGP